MNVLMLLFSLVLLGGCSTMSNVSSLEYIEIKDGRSVTNGTGTPWVEGVYVTAKHVALPASVEVLHECQTGCDLKFYARRETAPLPAWRAPQAGEKVVAAGFVRIQEGMTYQGAPRLMQLDVKDAELSISLADIPGAKYRGLIGRNKQGMSGGPIIAHDGEFVGIQIGQSKAKDGSPLIIYIPTDEIDKEWGVYLAQRVGKLAEHQ